MDYLAYVSIGSNTGNSIMNCDRAIIILKKISNIKIEQVSSYYKTEPIGIVSRNWFINCVVSLKTSMGPYTLLEKILSVEYTMGRVRHEDNKDRVIDLDLLLFEDKIINSKNLIVPHPRMYERSFMLTPLVELNPMIYHPTMRKKFSNLLLKLEGQKVYKVEHKELGMK